MPITLNGSTGITDADGGTGDGGGDDARDHEERPDHAGQRPREPPPALRRCRP